MEEEQKEIVKPSWIQTSVIILSIAIAAGGTLFQIKNNSEDIAINSNAIKEINRGCAATSVKIAVIQQVRNEQSLWMRDMVSSIKDMVIELKALNGRVIRTELHVESLNAKMEDFKADSNYNMNHSKKKSSENQAF